ncbi:DgyrCDS473 [Dimorphilus gyrociliatus]|uniref:DgyrCDS473 n=1 Tax=Dimorphilus gyrociliatus TaxID=2664684 RepID=A0A7I8V4R7_9ANNE|nr:DgyrCDS473 [Dimorphilus gyrociliatus]
MNNNKYQQNKSAEYRRDDEEVEASFNPNPLPFKTESFKSSTVVKRVPLMNRNEYAHFLFAQPDQTYMPKTRGLFLRTERYETEEKCSFRETSPTNQRERIQAERVYGDRMKDWRRRREFMTHRIPHHLLLGGTKVAMNERMDITGEIRRLKQVTLPDRAKDLYVGRGIKLPPTHGINKPKVLPTPPSMLKKEKRVHTLVQPPPTASNKTVFSEVFQTYADRFDPEKVDILYSSIKNESEIIQFQHFEQSIKSNLTKCQIEYLQKFFQELIFAKEDKNSVFFFSALADCIADWADEDITQSFDKYQYEDFEQNLYSHAHSFVSIDLEKKGVANLEALIKNLNLKDSDCRPLLNVNTFLFSL